MKTLMIPRQTDALDTEEVLPLGQTHGSDETCPFTGLVRAETCTTCCSFDTSKAVNALYDLGKVDLAKSLRRDLGSISAQSIARDLRRVADLFERRYAQGVETENGVRRNGMVNTVTGDFIPWAQPMFDMVLTSIRNAADWYEKVGKLGFAVHVWS